MRAGRVVSGHAVYRLGRLAKKADELNDLMLDSGRLNGCGCITSLSQNAKEGRNDGHLTITHIYKGRRSDDIDEGRQKRKRMNTFTVHTQVCAEG